MIQKFLKAKHWQLFILLFGLPIVLQIAMTIMLLADISSGDNPDGSFVFNYMLFFPVIMILVVGTQFGWFWSIAIGLQNKVPSNVKMKVKKFKIFFFIPVIYITLVSIMIGLGLSMMYNDPVFNATLFASLMMFIIPIHLFSMFCIFYSLYFVAKTFKTVELQREVSFSDFVGEFFMIWFYPIGIWFIQPKINNMVENQREF